MEKETLEVHKSNKQKNGENIVVFGIGMCEDFFFCLFWGGCEMNVKGQVREEEEIKRVDKSIKIFTRNSFFCSKLNGNFICSVFMWNNFSDLWLYFYNFMLLMIKNGIVRFFGVN